jgi:hypothetical protein
MTQKTAADFKNLVLQLKRTLELQLKLHREFLAHMRRKRAALNQPNREALHGLLERIQEILGGIGLSERNRLELTGQIAERIASPSGRAMRLAELLPHVDEADRDELFDLRESLREVATEMAQVNQLNRMVIRRSQERQNFYIASSFEADLQANANSRS